MLTNQNSRVGKKTKCSGIITDAALVSLFALAAVLLLSAISASSAQTASGYPLNIQPLVPAKWDHLYLSICINSEDQKHEELIQKAIDKWKTVWSHFDYIIYDNKTTCNININVTKYPVGLNQERSSEGTTKLSYYEQRGIIYRADIFLFSHIKKSVEKNGHCCVELFDEMPDRKFYLIAMHEFGHVLNLDHVKQDDGLLPMDIMSGATDVDDIVISSEAIATLDRIYSKSSNVSGHQITFGLNSTNVSMDTERLYHVGDTVHLSGKVTDNDGGGIFTIVKINEPFSNILTHSSVRDKLFEMCPKHCGTFAINEEDGTFSMDLKLNHTGMQLLLIRYGDTSKYFVVDVAEPERARPMCFDENTFQNSWQKIEFLKMQDDYLSKQQFGNKVRQSMFNEYCSTVVVLTEVIALTDSVKITN